jgi:hypothetical protein
MKVNVPTVILVTTVHTLDYSLHLISVQQDFTAVVVLMFPLHWVTTLVMVVCVLYPITALNEVLYHLPVQKEHTTILLEHLFALSVHLAIIATRILLHTRVRLAQQDTIVQRELLHQLSSHVHLVPTIIAPWLRAANFVYLVHLVCTVKVMGIFFQQDFVKMDGFVYWVLTLVHLIIA